MTNLPFTFRSRTKIRNDLRQIWEDGRSNDERNERAFRGINGQARSYNHSDGLQENRRRS
ncbi:hypothetical protein [Spirosoma sp.]|uniref:hypothetical protein n=1 Tax=Spirosoma sp. TaxID=1899569 RepID=UPI003B3AD08A